MFPAEALKFPRRQSDTVDTSSGKEVVSPNKSAPAKVIPSDNLSAIESAI